ncbi:diol dehydratase reactivase subunit alpha [Candidatus Cetobacterium colombiensis]|uniref:Diol dehydratase reactivase subunit alpha n=1 Tax=Candidatus Cetobacterium colombiensis TaxID=3073100 RepID=A0ABU4W7D9_9FUSO|nr:diol dehydratase reactivase subunit alpha [Candidatus Cetobacterium colombiensis]MDX8335149.1 diol dehydratase reactivase subunit alpha [Candidatus Cetobacterium colombiensis]
MEIIAGVDIGNATTEVAIAKKDEMKIEFMGSSLYKTTGLKGTEENIEGIKKAILLLLEKLNLKLENLDLIRINEATPVIGDVSMETITETIITESTMIGHNPDTPGGCGIGLGITIDIDDLQNLLENDEENYIVIANGNKNFLEIAKILNFSRNRGIKVMGAILQKDDGVLVNNRLLVKIPIVDEVQLIEKIPLGVKCCIEVASKGRVIEKISNPYGIATVFNLNSEETKKVVPLSKALIGNRSGVVIKTPQGDVKEKIIPAGNLYIKTNKSLESVGIQEGAEKIMKKISFLDVEDIFGEDGTNVGGMLKNVKNTMHKFTGENIDDIKIKDLLAVDTFVPQKIKGGLAGEFMCENAVGLAVMVGTEKNQMNHLANMIKNELGVNVEVGGVEADMAIKGALTTPGTGKPLAIIDIGAGSTDACSIDKYGRRSHIHLAGAGNMVTLLIQKELGIEDFNLAEDIKKYPLAKVESFFNIRYEDGTVEFFNEPLSTDIFAKNVLVKNGELVPIDIKISLEKIRQIRRESKRKVFVTNSKRALRKISLTKDIRDFEFVIIVGGSALDFEVPEMITESLSKYGIVAGCGNIRGVEGPRNAVATGLVLGDEEC